MAINPARFVDILMLVVLFVAGALLPPSVSAQEPPVMTAASADLWLEATFEPAEVYVQAQAVYTLRLYQAIDVRELRLEVPAPALGELRQIGEDRVDEATRNGRRYRVTERRFAVFPFASGKFTIPGAHAAGFVAAPSGAPGGRAPLKLAAPPVALSVLAIPAEAPPGAWLPARELSLVESWAPSPAELRAGETVQRTVRIEAYGVDAAQLPSPDLQTEGFSLHPDPPDFENRFDGEWNVGIREQSWRITPQRSGYLVVPEVRFEWWDAVAGEPRVATLPAHTISVPRLAASGSRPAPSPAALPADSPAPAIIATAANSRIAPPPVVALLAALAILVALAPVVSRLRRRDAASLRALRTACRRSDARTARDALLALAAKRWSVEPPRSLGELALRLSDPGARAAIMSLDRHLYGEPGAHWDGSGLLAHERTLWKTPASRRQSRRNGLPPLYRT